MKTRTYSEVDILLSEYDVRKADIRRRLCEFAAVPGSDYFYELAYCLLTPQSSAVHAGMAVAELRDRGFLEHDIDPVPILRNPEGYIRFHNTKARHLLAAKAMFPEIMQRLSDGIPGVELRAWLAARVTGLGWKESSHFLRNIGYRDLGILDRHILKNLKRHRVLRVLPATLTPKRYFTIEKRFKQFGLDVDIPMDELDLLFWSRETGEILK